MKDDNKKEISLLHLSICLTEKEALKKLTHKERKKLKQQLEFERQTAALLKKGGHGSSALDDTFAVSQAEKSEKVQMQLENAVDIKVC